MCDEMGNQMIQQVPEEVIDPQYFLDMTHGLTDLDNRVYQEMWQYFRKKNPQLDHQAVRNHLAQCRSDFVEIYCSESSQLTHQCQILGLRAIRFGLKQGDLSTFAGQCQLYDVLWTYRPRHVWMSPKCGPWSAWNRLNMQKSISLEQKILQDGRSENVHLLLCDAVFRLQDWRGPECHFHLEQPQGSELVFQREMHNVYENTFKAICDMCTAGKLQHPNTHEPLRKRTQILTTHQHDVIAGSCKAPKLGRMPLTQYTEMYTAVFGRRIGRALRCSSHFQEQVANYVNVFANTPDLAFAATPAGADLPNAKRRRLAGKFNPEQLYVPSSLSSSGTPETDPPQSHVDEHRSRLNQILHLAEQCTPRVGKVVLQDGPIFQHIQDLYPDKHIVVLDLCRGMNRLRVCPIGPKGIAPYRRVIGRRRSDLTVFADETWESWEELSHRQQVRGGIPSKLLITIFATAKRPGSNQDEEMPEPKRPRPEEPEIHANPPIDDGATRIH